MPATLKTQIKDLEALMASRGWQRLTAALDEEMVNAARRLAQDPNMSEKEVDFRRGAIWAAERLQSFPDYLLMQLKNADAIDTLTKADKALGPIDTDDTP